MFAPAVDSVDAPLGVRDRIRLDKITLVADGALPLAGGLPSNNPDNNDRTVDLVWVFPATGTNGRSIPADTILRLDAATAYRVTTGQVIAGGTATLPVEANLAGSAANLVEGASLSFESPIPGVTATATVATGGITGGVDEEGAEELRDRYLLRLPNRRMVAPIRTTRHGRWRSQA